MHWTRRVGLICLLTVGWATHGSAQDIIDSGSEVVFQDDFSGSVSLSNDGGTYLLFHRIVGDGVGYQDGGYQRIGLRAKLFDTVDSHLFGEVHTLVTDSSRIGFNAGGGYRWLLQNAVLGVNGWYDNYESSLGNRYQQITFGGEYLSPGFDVRANGYIPFGEQENLVGILDYGNVPTFYRNLLVTQGIGQFERAYSGFDIEGGVPFPVIEWLRMYGGTYFLDFDGDDTLGLRARAEGRVAQGVTLNLQLTEDDKFGTNLNLDVEVRFSGSMPTRFGQDYSAVSRRYDQVRRQWNVQVSQDEDGINLPLNDPNTGDPLRFFWVDNTAGPGGAGTFENPFQRLPGQARDSDFILVRTGNGGTQGNVALLPGQSILGEGKAHFVDTDRLGLIQLPEEFSSTGALPTLVGDGTATPVITLANDSLVRGFDIDALSGIFGSDISNFHIECVTGDVHTGIQIQGADGLAVLRDVDFRNVRPGGTGILVSNVNGTPLILDADNVRTSGGDRGFVIDADGGNILATLGDVTATNFGVSGLALEAGRLADLNVVADDVSTSNGAGTGVVIDLEGATGIATLTGLQANNNGQDGLRTEASLGTDFDLNIIDSSLTGNADDNIEASSVRLSTLNVLVDPTTAQNAGDNAFEFLANDRSTLNATLQDVDLSQTNAGGNNAVRGLVDNNSTVNLDFQNVAGNRYANDGINITVQGQSSLSGSVVDASFSNSGRNGVNLNILEGGQADLTLANFTSDGNGSTGLDFDVTGGSIGQSSLNLTVNDGSLSNNARANVDGLARNGGIANMTFNDVTADGGGTLGGVLLEAQSRGELNATWDGGSVSGTAGNGISITSSGAFSDANFTIADAAINNNTGDGINLEVDGTNASGSLQADNVSTTGNGGSGIVLDATNGGSAMSLLSNIDGTGNGENGLAFSTTNGGELGLLATSSDFSGNGTSGAFSGVQGDSSGFGSNATAIFDGVRADSNPTNGFEFEVDDLGSLIAELRTDTNGTTSASRNQESGVRFTGTNADQAVLLMSGPNDFRSNGLGTPSPGVAVDIDGANVAVASFSGSSVANNGDGVNISLQNVIAGAIEIQDDTGEITRNAGDGVEIDLLNTNLQTIDVDGRMIAGLDISGVNVSNNSSDGINIFSSNTDLDSGSIDNITASNNRNGLVVQLTQGSDWDLDVTNSQIHANQIYGIRILSDSNDTMSTITVDGNELVSNSDTNILVDLSGSAVTELHVDNNLLDGDGRQGGFTPGMIISGGTINESPLIPPDTMGGVGIDHIIEFTNGRYAVFDKSTGALVTTTTLDRFWINAGLPDVDGGTFDPRVIFDPTVNRWFMTSIDRAANGNNIYIAVSNTENPLDGFQGMRFRGDSNGVRFNDFDTFGVDAEGVYIATRNFSFQTDVSIYSIPKADLLGATPTLANMTRFENLNDNIFGEVLQPVVDFGPSDGRATLLSAREFGGFDLVRTDITNTSGVPALLGPAQSIPVGFYSLPQGGTQPGAPDVEHDSNRFWSNVVEVNDTIWAAHSVLGSTGNDAIRWYQIDEVTSQVLQSGTIQDPNLDFLYPSIAVNPTGQVVIGMSISGPSQFISTGAVFGDTVNGVTTFQTPQILQPGVDNYFVDFGSGRNRWGDYSATVVDPVDPNVFWTFQERVVAQDTWGVSVQQISFDPRSTVQGTTANHGINLNAGGSAIVRSSTIDGNTIESHGGDAILVSLDDAAIVESLDINNNIVTDNAGSAIRVITAGMPTIDNLRINMNELSDNGGRGVLVTAQDTDLGTVEINDNIVDNNTGGTGIEFSATNSTMNTLTLDSLSISGNTVTNSPGFGIDVWLDNMVANSVTLDGSTVQDNADIGIRFRAQDSPIGAFAMSNNTIVNNMGIDGALIALTNSPVNTFDIIGNEVAGSRGDALQIDLDNSPINFVNILGNTLGRTAGTTGGFIDDSLPLIRAGFDNFTLAPNDDGSTSLVDLGFNADFFGQQFTQAYVNNNGNITFDGPLFTFTPFPLLNTTAQIIAPFFADVDTRSHGNPVTYGQGTIAGRPAFGVNWIDVDYFVSDPNHANQLNTFQLVLIDRSDVRAGDFDIEFNYDQITWETGDASFGMNGLGGSSARVGFSNGVDTSFELVGSAINGALLDTGPAATSLIQNSINSSNLGRYIFFARNGGVGTVAPGTDADGLNFSILNGSDIGEMAIDQNAIELNARHGVNLTVVDSVLPANAISVSDNIISRNGTDGFRLVGPDTNGTPISIDFANNDISENENGIGINVNLDQNVASFNTNITGSSVNDNGAGGLVITAVDDVQVNANIGTADPADANTFSGNTLVGIGFDFDDNVTSNVAINNTTVADTVASQIDSRFMGDGIGIRAFNNVQFDSFSVDGSTLAMNEGDGLSVEVHSFVEIDDLTVQNSIFRENAIHGVDLDRISNVNFSNGLRGNVLLGGVGAGNTFIDNGDNTIDIFVAGGTDPQRFDIVENVISGGQDGVHLEATHATIVLGSIIDNSFANLGDDAIDLLINQDASLGNPFDPTDPFIVRGNQMDTGAGTGIVLNALDNATINIDLQAAGTRGTIANFTEGGILINDLSTVANSSYAIGGIDFSGIDAGDDVIQVNFANGNRTLGIDDVTSTGGRDTVRLIANNASVDATITNLTSSNIAGEGLNLDLLTSGAANVTIDNVTLNTVLGDDGIDLDLQSGADSAISVTNVTVNGAAGDGIELVDQSTGNTTLTMQTIRVEGSGEDGIDISKVSGGAIDATITDVQSSFNGGRGLMITATNDDAGRNVFNIGTIGGPENLFLSNGAEGILFRQTAQAISQDQTAMNPDVRVDENLENPAQGAYFDLASRDIVASTLNILNTTVTGSNANGILLEIGSSTLLNSQIAGVTSSANALDDLVITPIVSADPASSIDSAMANSDVLVYDPVAHLDLVLGGFDLDNDGIPEMADVNGDGILENPELLNSGDRMTVTFLGADFTNADPFKNDRQVRLAGQVQQVGTLNTSNDFFQLIQQDIEALFSGRAPVFNVIGPNLFPDPIVP